MSNLLERAIIDAKALKEAALKNAEQLVVEKYSLEVKEAMNQILESDEEEINEQEDDAMSDLFGDTETSPEEAMEEGEEDYINTDDLQSNLPDAFRTDEDQMIRIMLDSIDDDIEEPESTDSDKEISIDIVDDEFEDQEIDTDIDTDIETGIDMDTDTTPDMASDTSIDIGISPEALEEMTLEALSELDLGAEEIDLDELMERVRVDFEPVKSGWAGTPEKIMQEYESMLLAREQDSEVKEENEELRKNVAALQNENKTLSSAALKLQEKTEKYETAFNTLQEKLETMNVSNAKLLYINQALENASLNERQKKKIVEAISKAGTVQEAKIVFETMSDTVVTTSDVKRESTLSEMVSRKSSLLVAARKEQPKKDANPLFNRMQALAGIKTN